MEESELRQIEELCNALYTATNEQQRQQAHNTLYPLVQDVRHLPQLNYVLAKTQNQHALIFAATGLTKLLSANWMSVSEKTKEDMKNFMFQYLAQTGPTLYREAKVTVAPLVRLLVVLLKLLWLDGPQHQDIVQRLEPFLSESTLHWALALEIYTDLTCDMQPAVGPSMSRFRRTALSFRDTSLPAIIQIAMQTLQQIYQGKIKVANKSEETRLIKQVLQLTCNCLSFDFMGTIRDDTSDEQSTVMIPHCWSFLRDEGICPLFFEIYNSCCNNQRYDSAAVALQCLVLLASIRKSFFQKEEERSKLLEHLVQGTAAILVSNLGLAEDVWCYHEMCRLLGKINTANQIHELASTKVFLHWIQKVYSFTMDSLRTWEVMPNSKHYLLTFWATMVNPLLFMREKTPTGLETCIQQITLAYIESRLSMAEMSASNEAVDWDDPLIDEVLRGEQLQVLTDLGRYKYQETAQHIIKHYDEVMRVGPAQGKLVFEKKITWIVYMMGAMVSGHTTREKQKPREDAESNGAPGHVVNGELAGRVFRLINITDQEVNICEELELAYLYFLEQFRKVYIGEHAKHVVHQQVNERLAAVLGLEDENAILGLIINKVGKDLQTRYRSEAIIKRTLSLFHELAAGINIVHATDRSSQIIVSGRLLLQNETVQQILKNHAAPEFGFLHHELTKFGRSRTIYYQILGKLLFLEVRENKSEFESFMRPQALVIDQLWTIAQSNLQGLRTPESKHALIGLCRDLRGICISCSNSESYNFFFEWLVNYPKQEQSRVNLFAKAVEVWWDDHEVTTPLLKFFTEFVYNKIQRITFDQSSPNGILLFREASRILYAYGTRILQRSDDQRRSVYKEKYKGMGVALELFCHALNGNYTNFGVFELYNDDSLATSMKLCLNICLAIPMPELAAYIKTFKPYYFFLELATKSHMSKVMELEGSQLTQLLSSVEEGLLSFDMSVSMQSCMATDNLVAHFFSHQDKQSPEGEKVRRFQATQSESLRRILKLMFHLVMNGENNNTWSISRPLLGLILIYNTEYQQIRDAIAGAQLTERRAKLLTAFDELMKGVDNNILTKNKDHFTRNLYNFSTILRQIN